MKKLSDILEKLQSKYPDDKDIEMALELAPEDEMDMEEGDDLLGMEEEPMDMDMGMEEEEGGATDDLGLPLPEEDEDMMDMEEEPKKKKKKPSMDMMGL